MSSDKHFLSHERPDTMKALILSGGKGTRLRPFTETTTKQLLPVANRPILFYILDIVKQAGITAAGIVVSREWAEQVKTAVGSGSAWNTDALYIVQDKPLGLAHAVKISQIFLSDSPFLMLLGDNVYNIDIKKFIRDFLQRKASGLVLVKEVECPQSYGIASVDSDLRIEEVSEKPVKPKSNLALAGIYLFSSAVHRAVAEIKPSARGELEITDAIQKMIESGENVYAHRLHGWWLDTGTRDDWLKANRLVLSDFLLTGVKGKIDKESTLKGKIVIENGTMIKRSTIHGPAAIAQDCIIEDSLIGPNVSVGAETKIRRSSVENSIIMEGCELTSISHIKDAIIGKRTKMSGS